MSQLTEITAAAWNTSGAASTGSTGLNTLTGTWTHVGSTDVPFGSSANGYIRMADDAGGTFRIDATSVPFVSDTEYYYVRFWLRAVRTATTLVADATGPRLMDVNGTGRFLLTWYVRNNDIRPGFAPAIGRFNLSPAGTIDDLTGGSSGGTTVVPFGEWVEQTIKLRRHATEGEVVHYLNRAVMNRLHSADTTDISLAAAQNFTISLPATNGIQWQIAGPLESWDGTDIPLLPLHTANDASGHVRQFHATRFVDLPGGHWTSSGAATGTWTTYTGSGINPVRGRFVVTGAATSKTYTTVQDIGPLPYNTDGWATVEWMDFYFPDTGAGSITLKNTGGAALVKLDITGGELKQGSTVLASIANNKRYNLRIHLKDTGEATWVLTDLTSQISVRARWSGDLTDWVPQDVGVIELSATVGTSGIEMGGVLVCKIADEVMTDSLVHAAANGVSPALAARNHITVYLPYGDDPMAVPGAAYSMYHVGLPRCVPLIVGRSGDTRNSYTTNVLAYSDGMRATKVICVDGGSINDIGSVTDEASFNTITERIIDQTRTQIQTLTALGCRVQLTTMRPRVQGTYTQIQLDAIDAVNEGWRLIAKGEQVNGLVTISDVVTANSNHASFFTSGDNVHFNATGDQETARLIVTEEETEDPIVYSVFGGPVAVVA